MKKLLNGKRIYALVLVLVMVVSMTACGTKEKKPNDAGTPNVSTTEDGAATVSPEAVDPMGKYETPIDIEFVTSTNDNIEKNLLEANGWSWEDNIWTNYYKDKLGINLKWKWIAKGDEQYNTKINLMLANGDLPDFFGVNLVQLKQLVEAGLIADLTDVYDTYSSELTKNIVAESGNAPLAAATFDGKLYGIPKVYPSYDRAKFLYIRKDWLDTLGLQVPTTMDQLIEVAIAFATKDPDGNGIKDTYGFGLTKNLIDGGHEIKGFSYGYGATPDQWIEKDGKLVYGGIQPEMKEALTGLQAMYNGGAIDKEFGVKDFDKVSSDVNSGKIGMTYGEHWLAVVINQVRSIDEKSEIEAYKIPSVDGSDPTNIMDLGTNKWFVARKDTANPEAIVKMLNIVTDMQYGETFSADLQKNSDLSPIFIVRENNNLISYQNEVDYFINKVPFSEVKWNGARASEEDFLTNDGVAKYMLDKDRGADAYGWAHIYGPIEGATMPILKYYVDNKTLKINRFIGAPTETMGDKKALLDELQITTFSKIIQGGSLDDFDKFVSDWNNMGGSKITEEVNEWYAGVADKNY